MSKITYYAANDTMGDTSDRDCNAYRAWALEELRNEYPEHDVSVESEPSLQQVRTDDDERSEEIAEFCSRLWDRCPWNWQ